MSSKRPNDMKNAFQALRVNQPLRLPKTGPALAPPTEAPVNVVPQSEPSPAEAPLSEVAQRERPQREAARSEQPPIEQPRNEVARSEPSPIQQPRNEVARSEQAPIEQPHTEVAHGQSPIKNTHDESTRNEVTHSGPPFIEAATSRLPRYEAPALEVPRLQAAQDEEAVASEPGGFFKLSHTLFADPRVREMSGDCFRLFLWLSMRAWRFPDSTGVVRASVRFVEEATGMGHATVSRALKVLKEDGLVEALEVDYKRGNVWKVARLALPGSTPDPKPRAKRTRNEVPHSEAPLRGNEVPSNRASSVLKTRGQAPQIEDHYKNYKNLKKHSQEALAGFFERLAVIEAPRKRETEISNLDSLLSTFSPEQIEAALSHVESKGTLRGERCHSPFSYLSFAMDDVLKRITPAKREELPAVPTELAGDVEDRKAALATFETELSPDAQNEVLERFAERQFPHGFLPPRHVIRGMAAAAWFAGARSNDTNQVLFAAN